MFGKQDVGKIDTGDVLFCQCSFFHPHIAI
jgi:hypothetical protein